MSDESERTERIIYMGIAGVIVSLIFSITTCYAVEGNSKRNAIRDIVAKGHTPQAAQCAIAQTASREVCAIIAAGDTAR